MSLPSRVAVLGDVILDQTTTVRVRGVSPENSAVLVSTVQRVDYNLGGAANVARGVKALGGDALLLGFNNDRRVDSLVEVAQVAHQFARPMKGYTPVKNRIVTEDGHYIHRIDDEADRFDMPQDFWGSWADADNQVRAALKEFLLPAPRTHRVGAVCLVDYGKGFFSTRAYKAIMWNIDQVHESVRFPVIVDPGRLGHWGRFGSPRTVFRANLAQVQRHFECVRERVAGDAIDPSTLADYADKARAVVENLRRDKTAFAAVVLTLGPAGIAAAAGLGSVYVPAGEVTAVDVCGAGDSVTAALATYLAADPYPLVWDVIVDAVKHAERVARASVARRGVYAVTREDVE